MMVKGTMTMFLVIFDSSRWSPAVVRRSRSCATRPRPDAGGHSPPARAPRWTSAKTARWMTGEQERAQATTRHEQDRLCVGRRRRRTGARAAGTTFPASSPSASRRGLGPGRRHQDLDARQLLVQDRLVNLIDVDVGRGQEEIPAELSAATCLRAGTRFRYQWAIQGPQDRVVHRCEEVVIGGANAIERVQQV
jgi:hypothetical protein